MFYVVHYPLVATSIRTIISYIYQWILNRLLSPQGVIGSGPTSPPRCWAMSYLHAPSLSPWSGFLSILCSLLANHALSRYSLSTSFPHDIWSECHAKNPMPHTWLCNQWSLCIHQSISNAVLRYMIRTPSCVPPMSTEMINPFKVCTLPAT